MPEDKGHIALIDDLCDLFNLASAFEFHDFKNNTYAMPKVELVRRLDEMRKKTIEGDYDN